MITKHLRDLYPIPISTISTDKTWGTLLSSIESLEKETNEDIEIDFSGITIVDPWRCENFKLLIAKPHIHFIFKNCDDIVRHLQLVCTLDGLDFENRIKHVVVEIPREKTDEEKKVEYKGGIWAEAFKIDKENGVSTLDLFAKIRKLENPTTVNYIEFAINKISEETGIKKFTINWGEVRSDSVTIEYMVKMMLRFGEKGITVNMDIQNEDEIKLFGLHLHKLNTKDPTVGDKYTIIHDMFSLHKPIVGILIQYKNKKNNKKDEFGRQGKGEVNMSRIAVLTDVRGNAKTGGTATFLTYNSNYFFTRQHWAVTHDNEELKELKVDRMDVPISELGFLNEFMGSTFHFIEPIQKKKSYSSKVIYDLTDSGSNISKLCTIPERIKYVFNDWGIEYDEELLNKAIMDTNKYIADNEDDSDDQMRMGIMQELMDM